MTTVHPGDVENLMAARVRLTVRRELAEKILLKLIEISPGVGFFAGDSAGDGEGVRVAWSIADAFLKAEPQE